MNSRVSARLEEGVGRCLHPGGHRRRRQVDRFDVLPRGDRVVEDDDFDRLIRVARFVLSPHPYRQFAPQLRPVGTPTIISHSKKFPIYYLFESSIPRLEKRINLNVRQTPRLERTSEQEK